ncbi:AAA family ATPase [Oryzibacter oryziterrae]|uniref:AAA family ATPase n=1 Tax=Oryzibacter oryziterrae TaxID=2766474 RepID=UPI001F022731|nr:AAA family ATPase [Oryzibacter oryziterrae]
MQAAARLTVGFELESTEVLGIATSNLPAYDHIFQIGRKPEQVVKAVRRVTEALGQRSATPRKETLTLDELPGMGTATIWAKEVIRDLEDWKAGKIKWADVDRGIVLYGPPGTGKTTFAKAIAGSAKIPLIAGSIAKWQSSGHLGDMLKSMRSAFASAVRQAPSVLLIDEIDVVGDRAKFDSQHRDYDNKVVAALLELLDGADTREGVIVIGTSNFHPPDVLDPALIRPGRLEAWIEIPMPDCRTRIEIMRYHGATIPDVELARIADRTEGRTGADLEALVRFAKRFARRASRPQRFDDYLLALPVVHPLPEQIRRRAAVHECGHGLAAVVLGHGRLDSIKILREIASDTGQIAAGRTTFEASLFGSRSRSEIQDEIVVMLAGMAAEELVYGDWTEGSGLSELSDLGQATSLALYMAGTLGMSGSLARIIDDPTKVRHMDSGLRRSVDEVLAVCMERARAIVRGGKNALMRMSELLVTESELTLSTIRSIIDDDILPEALSDRH